MIKGKRALKIFRFLEFFRKKCLSFREKILEFEFFGLSLSFWALEFFSRRLKKNPGLGIGPRSRTYSRVFSLLSALKINLVTWLNGNCLAFVSKCQQHLTL